MPILPAEIIEGTTYITEENSLGHSQIKEVLKVIPDRQDTLYDTIEYRAKIFETSSPWITHKCMRKTFARHNNKISPSIAASLNLAKRT